MATAEDMVVVTAVVGMAAAAAVGVDLPRGLFLVGYYGGPGGYYGPVGCGWVRVQILSHGHWVIRRGGLSNILSVL